MEAISPRVRAQQRSHDSCSGLAVGEALSYVLYAMTTRINARLDADLAAAVEHVRRQTGMSLTQIVEAALRAWTTQEALSRPSPERAFEAAGFIGSGKGPVDLARNAKAELTRSLKRKT